MTRARAIGELAVVSLLFSAGVAFLVVVGAYAVRHVFARSRGLASPFALAYLKRGLVASSRLAAR